MPGRPDFAIPRGSDPTALTRELLHAHDSFLDRGLVSDRVRFEVAESWQRSLSAGYDPERDLPGLTLDEATVRELRSEHRLAAVMPIIRQLLIDSATESGLLVAVSDEVGRLLWVEGSSALRTRAEGMHFVPGADWEETSAGTNAPGMALRLDKTVQLLGPEHLARSVLPWSCTATPIHDPDTGQLLGVLDLTGGPEGASAASLGLVKATAAAAEAELRIESLRAQVRGKSPRTPRRPSATSKKTETESPVAVPGLSVLGQRVGLLDDGAAARELTMRHSELLLLLAENPAGWTAAKLALGLNESESSEVTIRAEISRLRNVVKPLQLGSRPYRLKTELRTDVAHLRETLAAGDLDAAVRLYRGPVLPDSTAPLITQLREDLHELLRSQVVATGDADLMLRFADAPHSHDDLDLWMRISDVIAPGAPRYVQVMERVARLDAELAS